MAFYTAPIKVSGPVSFKTGSTGTTTIAPIAPKIPVLGGILSGLFNAKPKTPQIFSTPISRFSSLGIK